MLFLPIRSDLDLMLDFADTPTTLTKWGERGDLNIYQHFIRDTSPMTIVLVVFQILFLIVLYAGVGVGIYKGFTMLDIKSFIVISSIIIYFCILSGGPEAYARFRVPIMPFLAILSAVGIGNTREGFFRAKKK